MRIGTPPRKLKARLRILGLMLLLFATTFIVCVGVFALFLFSGVKVISPIAHLLQQKNATDEIRLVKSLCESDHLVCQQVSALSQDTIQVILDTNTVVLLSTKKDLKKQLSSLQEALSQLTIKGKQIKSVDFRFAHVVVSF